MGIMAKQGFSDEMSFVKQWKPGKESVRLSGFRIKAQSPELANEKKHLSDILKNAGAIERTDGMEIHLNLSPLAPPIGESFWKNLKERQSFQMNVASESIRILSPSPEGVFYGIETLARMIGSDARIPCGEVVDWPDIPIRMIMLDPARQNENFDFYKRVIRFCSKYRINSILIHLTDDQTSCLFHEDYPWLMHPQAWKPDQIRDLVKYAAQFHIELIPEIESFGHAEMFVRHPEFRDILHQTDKKTRGDSWYGTDVEGFTNVLCPASEKTYVYLEKMYRRAAETFSSSLIHIGCDEVDMTRCSRCEAKFPGISSSEWFRTHLLRCKDLVEKNGRKTALWGDMILKNPDILNGFPPKDVIIYDWHYREDTKAETSRFFKDKGFEVVGCPALVCSPHMVIPAKRNFENIRIFSDIARENDLMGLNATIWVPTRYLSDILWQGIAYAAERSWGGGHFDEESFYKDFMRDFYGSEEGGAFYKTWKDLTSITWYRNEFNAGCWMNEKSLQNAQTLASSKANLVKDYLKKLQAIKGEWKRLGSSVKTNREAWNAIERSTIIFEYSMKHLMASEEVRKQGKADAQLIRDLDRECVQAINWIEEDWNRNRYPDDPNKNGLYLPEQHILFRFKQMHDYHGKMLEE
ncbi:family 20 glycosylhydrolase [Candidatus Sumerlaeota bacterium]|nr:family 20 glycosylhydrolase [Candidatus Sumerlaeota bacterium]